MSMTVLPCVASAAEPVSDGTIRGITAGGKVNGDELLFETPVLTWSDVDLAAGRNAAGWWVGATITAPASVTEQNLNQVVYYKGAAREEKKFAATNDGKNSEGLYQLHTWLLVKPETTATALELNSVLQMTYAFDWNGDGEVDQELVLSFDPRNTTLNKDNQVFAKTVNGVFTVKNGQAVLADYSDVNAAIAEANALDKELYVDFSGVERAVSAVIWDKPVTEQETVDGYAAAIRAAIGALTEKEPVSPPTGGSIAGIAAAAAIGVVVIVKGVSARRKRSARG